MRGRSGSSRGEQLAALSAYLLLSAFLFRDLVAHPSTTTYADNDVYLVSWWLRWVPFSLHHGQLPFHTDWIGFPDGVNAMWNASVLLLGLVASPLTVLAGPLVSYNALLIAAPALSAWVCFLVAGRLFGPGWPALVAGLLYGFSPYVMGQSAGHLQMTWALFPPLLVWLATELVVVQRIPARRLGVGLGIAIALQLLVGEELLASSAFLAAVSVLLLALRYRHEAVRRLPYAARALAWAAAVAIVVDAVPLAAQFFGTQRVKGQVQSVVPGADLLSFVLPGDRQVLRVPGTAHLARHVLGSNLAEQTAYVGLPLLILAFLCFRRLAPTTRILIGTPLAVAAIMTLGRHLAVGGHNTGIPLPAAAVAHVPLLQSMLPVRFSAYVFLLLALLLAAAFGRPPSQPEARSRAVLTGLAGAAAAACLLPAAFSTTTVHVPHFFAHPPDAALLPPGSSAFVAPYPDPSRAEPMLWQSTGGLRFKMVGGYFLGPGRHGHASFGTQPGPLALTVSSMLKGEPPPPTGGPVARAVAREAAELGLDELLVGPMPHAAVVARFLAGAVHRPARLVDGVWLIQLRAAGSS